MTIDGYGYRHCVCWTCMRNAYCLSKCKLTQWTNMDGFRYDIVFGIYFLEFNAGFDCNFDFGFNICLNFAQSPLHFWPKLRNLLSLKTLHLWCRVFLRFLLYFLRFRLYFLRFRLFFTKSRLCFSDIEPILLTLFSRYRVDTIDSVSLVSTANTYFWLHHLRLCRNSHEVCPRFVFHLSIYRSEHAHGM